MCRLLVSLLCLAKQFTILIKLNRSWGGRIVCQQLSKNGICSVGAMAHPSFMNESHISGVAGKYNSLRIMKLPFF
jgi:hypothetical protein